MLSKTFFILLNIVTKCNASFRSTIISFPSQPAEEVAYIILQQAKIDSVAVGTILDKLTYTNPAQLSELISTVLNANRYKSSRLGVRNTRETKDSVSRNILD